MQEENNEPRITNERPNSLALKKRQMAADRETTIKCHYSAIHFPFCQRCSFAIKKFYFSIFGYRCRQAQMDDDETIYEDDGWRLALDSLAWFVLSPPPFFLGLYSCLSRWLHDRNSRLICRLFSPNVFWLRIRWPFFSKRKSCELILWV